MPRARIIPKKNSLQVHEVLQINDAIFKEITTESFFINFLEFPFSIDSDNSMNDEVILNEKSILKIIHDSWDSFSHVEGLTMIVFSCCRYVKILTQISIPAVIARYSAKKNFKLFQGIGNIP